ncbi:transferrin receptor protein 2 isoform X2 [Zonotrichia albicollis]|uniref:transferrin receptor protein 2 isoform X2 n=1 Tax=Zonotrichia albicollis TaxID=44394 RepID=UPI003D80FDA7
METLRRCFHGRKPPGGGRGGGGGGGGVNGAAAPPPDTPPAETTPLAPPPGHAGPGLGHGVPIGAVGGCPWPHPLQDRGGGAAAGRLHPRSGLGRGQCRGSAPSAPPTGAAEATPEGGEGGAVGQGGQLGAARGGVGAWPSSRPISAERPGGGGAEPGLEPPPAPPPPSTGGLVYGHYGRPQDVAELRARGVELRGHLVLLRLGRGRPAQQVSAMFAAGALGVLFYRDPRDTAGLGGGPALGGGTTPTLHVQDGAGDPFSRGFPSFSGHAPPGPAPGVAPIPAHPLSAATAMRLMRSLGPPLAPPRWGVPGGSLRFRPRPGGRRLQLRVGAGTRPGTLTSVFGALRGRLEPDCYIIVGAQRDSLGPGAAASGVGTALLLELARFFAAIGREGFQLRRTLLFVSWDGAEFGHLGATEWLEGYPGLLHTKVAAYVSLDRPVLGADRFVVRTSPTLGPLIESALEQVESPNEGGKSLLEQLRRPGRGWESDVIRPLAPESGAFPFTAAAGVPALELGFDEAPGGGGGTRAALGTPEDTLSRLGARLRGRLPAVSRAVAAVAAQLLLRLGHDPRLPLEPAAIGDALVRQLAPLQARGLSLQCLSSARGGVVRAAAALRRDMSGSDGANERLNRGFNARLMAAEASLLSPFVSPLVSPFRHVLLGRGGHTLAALVAELGTQRGTPGDNEGTPGDNVGTPGDNVGTAGDKLGTRGNSTRTHRDSEGTLGNSQGTPGDNEGTPGDNVGTPGDHEGTPRDNEGTPGDHEGTSGDHEGTLGDSVQLRLALLAWTLRGTAGALAGDSGDIGDIGDIGGGLGDSGDCGDMGGGFGDIGGHGDIGDIKSGFGDIGGGRGDSWDSEDTWGYGDSWEQGGPGDRNGDFGDTQGDFGDRNGDFGDLGDTQGRVGPW